MKNWRTRLVLISTAAIFAIVILSAMNRQEKKGPIGVGDRIPDFSLNDQNGNQVRINDYVGKQVLVIYFYPKDDTRGCTKQACSFRDAYEDFTDLNVKVIGISGDDEASHSAFASKYQLPFTLLADNENRVRDLFGVPTNFMGLIPGRVTYVVDINGFVVYTFDSQLKTSKHIEEALKVVQSL